MLWAEACARGFACPIWMTYRQAQELGGQVRKGERGSLVVFADRFTRTETGDNGEDVEHHIPFLRSYTVFNCEQTDGLPAHYYARAESVIDPIQRIAACRNILREFEGGHTPWRKQSLLCDGHRSCADAALRGLPRR
jgi:antirestriction protein ArdC